jgi:hypothetical protein
VRSGQLFVRRVVKPENNWVLALAILCVAILPSQISAAVGIPPRVRLTGALVEIGETSRKGLLQEFQVIVGRQRRMFLLDKIDVAGTVGRTRITLQQLFPPVLRLVGPENLLQRLLSPAITGKDIVVDGLLYIGSRTIFLSEIEEIEVAGEIGP